MGKYISADNIEYCFDDATSKHQLLTNINLTISESEKVAIIGSSGSGKTTLLHILTGMLLPSSGTVKINGKSTKSMSAKSKRIWRASELGFMFQNQHFIHELSVLQNVCLPLWVTRSSEKKGYAIELLKQLGFNQSMMHGLVSHLSGGERSRAALARALVHQPKLVVADEPTSSLDHQLTESVFKHLMVLHQEQPFALLVATHDHSLLHYFDRVFHIQSGQLQEVEHE